MLIVAAQVVEGWGAFIFIVLAHLSVLTWLAAPLARAPSPVVAGIGLASLLVALLVTPVLGLVPPDLPIVPNPHEVADWFEAPLGFVLDPANHVHKQREWFGRMRPYIEIDWQGHMIWGITAAIIANLARRLAWHGS